MIFELSSSFNSSNLKCCIKTCEYFILTKRENCQIDNYGKLWKVWKETTFIKLCFFLIDLLAFEVGKLCPEVGIFASFFRPGSRSFALKSCPGAGILKKKITDPGGGGEGMETG